MFNKARAAVGYRKNRKYIGDICGLKSGVLYGNNICFKNYTKVFLVVADFNPEAKILYINVGYTEVGAIPNLYREGITEYLMMKVVS